MDDDDPVLVDASGRAVDTWRENYPYDERLKAERYDEQSIFCESSARVPEPDQGHRYQACSALRRPRRRGQACTIKRFMQHLNPRYARTVALTEPSDREQDPWYLQRYVPHLPTSGEMVLFDRSCYNRVGDAAVWAAAPTSS